jgi:hypothetical protein
MADSFLGNLINGPAKPVDANDPTYTSPEAIKQKYSLADALTGRATQPFAPNLFGVLAAGITGTNGGLQRSSAESALAQNSTMQNNAFKSAAAAPDNISAGRVLAGSGIPELGSKGLEAITSGRDQSEKNALERYKADSERIKANASADSVPKYTHNPVTGELYGNRTGLPPPGVATVDPAARGKAIVDKNFAEKEAPKLIVEEGKNIASATETHNTLQTMNELFKGGNVSAGWGADAKLTARKMLSQVLPNGWTDANKIADSELFGYLSQKGIFEYVQKLKPASNTDFAAAQKATISIQTDPSSLPTAMPVLSAVAARAALSSQLRANHYANTGRPIDGDMEVAIQNEINRRIPLPRPELLRKTQGPVTGERVQGKGGQQRFSEATPEQRAATGEAPPQGTPSTPAPSSKVDFTTLPAPKQVEAIKRLRSALQGPNAEQELAQFTEAFGPDAVKQAQRLIQGANFQPAGR